MMKIKGLFSIGIGWIIFPTDLLGCIEEASPSMIILNTDSLSFNDNFVCVKFSSYRTFNIKVSLLLIT